MIRDLTRDDVTEAASRVTQNARAAIRLLAMLEKRADLAPQRLLLLAALAGPPCSPGIVAAAGDLHRSGLSYLTR
jgi:hypothetical protein